MAQDPDPFHGLPNMGTIKSPKRYYPTDNGHPKQSQQHFLPPCTTQASPPARTDDQAGTPSDHRTPSSAPSPRSLATIVPGNVPRPSQSPVLGPGALQHGDSAASQQELVHKQECCSDDLQHRIKDMWPSRPSESDDCDEKYGIVQRRMSDTASGRRPPQSVHASQNHNDYEKLGLHSRDWMANSYNLFQHPYTWNGLPRATLPSLSHPVHYQNGLDLVDQGYSIHTSSAYDPEMGNLASTFDETNPNYGDLVPSTTDSFQGYTSSVENAPIPTVSPSNGVSLYDPTSAMCQDREDTVPRSEGDVFPEHKDDMWWQDHLLGDSPSFMDASGSKVDEPYAQLIYRAFMSRPDKSMTLQEIYQWFRDNTDKSKAEGKGWQNSIRHNLSMNGAFTKRNSKTPLSGNGDGSVSLDNTGVDGRKSTEWFLEPAFYAGVESTTRYRKGNSGSRSRGAGGHPARSRLGMDSHSGAGAGLSHARVSAGRKGGNVAAQNRKRMAGRQQHARQMEMAREHPRHLQQQQHQGYEGPMATTPYGGLEDYCAQYPAPHLAPSPFPPGYGDVPAAIGQGQGTRQADIVYECFDSDDVGRDVHVNRSQTLGTDNDYSEPTTPPGSTLDPPRPADLRSKHRDFLPEIGSYNPLNSYQIDVGLEQHQQLPQQLQQHVYSFSDVTGFYDPPIGGPQPSVFVDEDINLSPDDTLLMNLDFVE